VINKSRDRPTHGLDYSSTPLGASEIESTFATVRLRQRVTKRLGSRGAVRNADRLVRGVVGVRELRRGSLKISGVDLSISRLAVRLTATGPVMTRR
jgi:hypothetical protein